MTDSELMLLISRVRRAFPRSGDILSLCEAAEALLTGRSKTKATPWKDEGMSRATWYRRRKKAG